MVVAGVDVRRHEIDWQIFLCAETKEFRHPLRCGCRRTADPQLLIHPLDRLRRCFVHGEIIGLGPTEEPGQIRLVPHFEIPLTHFVRAIAIDQMAHEPGYELPPGFGRRGRRDIGIVGEVELCIPARQLLGHETQFDKGLDAALQQAVIYGIDILEVRVLAIHAAWPDAQIIIEDAMEAHPLKASFVTKALQIIPPRLPQGRRCAI